MADGWSRLPRAVKTDDSNRRVMAQEMYFEDFYPGQTFDSVRSYRVSAKEIISFGEKYDPQPFHIDEAAGKSLFLQRALRLGLADGRDRDAAAGGVDQGGGRDDRRRRGRDSLDASGEAR